MESSKEAAVAGGLGPRRVIKRYSNRKLYDTKDSRYVTLQQIGEMVRAGEEVQIIDNKSKEDKTEVTLALILSEDLKSEPRSVPLAALRDLIQERGGKLWSQLREGTLSRFMAAEAEKSAGAADAAELADALDQADKANEAALDSRPAADSRSGDEKERAIPAPTPSQLKSRQEEKKGRLSELMESSITTLDERIRAIVPSAKSFSELREEVLRLTERVEQLEKQLTDQRLTELKNSDKVRR